MLSQSSKDDMNEGGHSQSASQRKTNQSFATVRQSNESPMQALRDSQGDYNDTKRNRFIPAIFSNSFSKTYADLLRNMNPNEMKSEITDSEAGSYPSPIFRSKQALEGAVPP